MDDTNRELEQIERATSGGLGGAALDESSDLSALHEGWSALVQLVEATDASDSFDERAFLEKLSRAVENDRLAGRGADAARRGDGKLKRRWMLLLSALAASIVVCIGAGIYYASQQENGGLGVKPATDTKPEDSNEQTEIANSNVPHTSSDAGLGWDDALDDQIQYVNQSLIQMESGDSRHDRSYRSFGSRLEEFDNEIEVDSL